MECLRAHLGWGICRTVNTGLGEMAITSRVVSSALLAHSTTVGRFRRARLRGERE